MLPVELQDRMLRDPNMLGELLRAFVFPGDDRFAGVCGCYSTFDTHPAARPMRRGRVGVLLAEAYGSDAEDLPDDVAAAEGYVIGHDHGRVEVLWRWDGDGSLFFWCYDRHGRLQVAVQNDDCKKRDRWQVLGYTPRTAAGDGPF